MRDTPETPPARSLSPRVQKQQPPKPRPPTAGSGKLARIAPLCLGLACATPSAWPSPPPGEECPPGAWEAMAQWEIRPSDKVLALFQPVAGVVSRREGAVTVKTDEALRKAPSGLILSGQLYFGEKHVYGRFTWARKGDLSFPVCLELWSVAPYKRGVEMEPGSTAETARFVSAAFVKAVERFE